ncbi:MAG: DinB family protein [Flavobacteriaceae bacterium]|nr:DinB family protein [Flavobacteriaceae bacterium]
MVNDLERELDFGVHLISKFTEEEMALKSTPEKWSKKEILGHLIDSAINNLQRFIEIQFAEKLYVVRKYNQVELVKANDYQNSETRELLNFWLSINKRIKKVIEKQTEETLKYKVQINDERIVDLRFLIKDYIDHLAHHLQQIRN